MFRDLRPYICTHEYCTEADQQYDSITDWITHEYYNHNDAMQYPGKVYSDHFLASQQGDISRPPGLYEVCREQCPICDKEKPSVSHVSHHLRTIAAFALPMSMILEDDIAPGIPDSNDAIWKSDDDSDERLSDFELEDPEDVCYQDPPPTNFQQNQSQRYHPILGGDRQLHSKQLLNQPIDTSNLDLCRVLYEITSEINSSTSGIYLEAKPGDLVAIVSKSAPAGDAGESWLCRAHDGRQGFLPLTSLEIVRKGAQPQAQIKDEVMASTMTTLGTTRANLLFSNAGKQLDLSSQTESSIKDYLSSLDIDGPEQDAGQWSEVLSQQASVSESMPSSRPSGYDPSQPPDDRIVESHFQDVMMKQKAKQTETTLTQNPIAKSSAFPQNLCFYVRIEPLSPDYGVHGQPIRYSEPGDWLPPNRPNGLTDGDGRVLFLRWEGGRITTVPPNDSIRGADLNRYVYRAATAFNSYPRLLAVPFDARTRSIYAIFGRGWQATSFNHNQIGNSNAYYSYISDVGSERRLAAPGSEYWMPQLLDFFYDCDPRHALRTQAGLIGQLPLLFALAAFSAPAQSLEVLLSSIQPGKWSPHGLKAGRK